MRDSRGASSTTRAKSALARPVSVADPPLAVWFRLSQVLVTVHPDSTEAEHV